MKHSIKSRLHYEFIGEGERRNHIGQHSSAIKTFATARPNFRSIGNVGSELQ